MESNFIYYNSIITYLGTLNQESLKSTLNSLIEELPATIRLIDSNVELKEWENYKFVDMRFLFHVANKLFSTQEAKNEYIKKFRHKWSEKIDNCLSNMKLIYSIEVS